jgi:hypothetical protein
MNIQQFQSLYEQCINEQSKYVSSLQSTDDGDKKRKFRLLIKNTNNIIIALMKYIQSRQMEL